jgi:hypothetical protein
MRRLRAGWRVELRRATTSRQQIFCRRMTQVTEFILTKDWQSWFNSKGWEVGEGCVSELFHASAAASETQRDVDG